MGPNGPAGMRMRIASSKLGVAWRDPVADSSSPHRRVGRKFGLIGENGVGAFSVVGGCCEEWVIL
jgi:hypothetical protein